MAPPLSGYIDESIHESHGLYVVGLVLVDPELRPAVRRTLARLIPAARRPHWKHEDAATRAKLVEAIAGFDIDARVYGCRFDRPRRQEAARARALAWMVVDLPASVRAVVLDRRDPTQDMRDRRVLAGLAGRPSRFAYDHVPSADEPLLWVADIVTSAVASGLVGKDDAYHAGLERILATVECEP